MHFINASDLMDDDWRFLQGVGENDDFDWSFHYGKPKNLIERNIPRPHLGRIRASLTASLEARRTPNAILVSHLPRISAVTNLFRKKLCPASRQIAFSFNFTDLPRGKDRTRLTEGLKGIEEFVVFSKYERELYADFFSIPEKKFQYLPWAMNAPTVGESSPIQTKGPYICAVGGEGRDYGLLANTMKNLPNFNLVLIARPHSIEGVQFPSNVEVFTNLPSKITWKIASDSIGMVLPLVSDKTACGHITTIGAQLLGIPLVITKSVGVVDYIENGKTGFEVEAGNQDSLIAAVELLFTEQSKVKSVSHFAQENALENNSLNIWCDYFRGLKNR